MWVRYRQQKDMKEKVNKGWWRIRGNALTVVGLPEVEVEEEEKVVVKVVEVKMSYNLFKGDFKYFKNISQIVHR